MQVLASPGVITPEDTMSKYILCLLLLFFLPPVGIIVTGWAFWEDYVELKPSGESQ